MNTQPMSCERARDALLLRQSGELDASGQAQLAPHLADCEPCRLYAEECAWLMRTVRDSETIPPLPTGAVHRIRQAACPRRALVLRPSAWWLAAAATLLLTLGGAWWLTQQAPVAIIAAAPPVRETLVSDVFDTELDARIEDLRMELAQMIGDTAGDWAPEDDDSLARQLLALEELTS